MRPGPVKILSNLMAIIILSVIGIGIFILASYAESSKGLKANLELCHKDVECCCGQYCLYFAKTKSYACQCKSDRWWNGALPYCRKPLNKNLMILS